MFIDFWCEIYESVKRKPSRTILTGIGISWGIFILIVLVGIGSGFERGDVGFGKTEVAIQIGRAHV